VTLTGTATDSGSNSITDTLSFTVTLKDPCEHANSNALIAPTLSKMSFFFASTGTDVTYTLPRIDDSANASYGTDPLSSICGA
jgi:hypothetical protein